MRLLVRELEKSQLPIFFGIDSELFLFDENGNLLAENDDFMQISIQEVLVSFKLLYTIYFS